MDFSQFPLTGNELVYMRVKGNYSSFFATFSAFDTSNRSLHSQTAGQGAQRHRLNSNPSNRRTRHASNSVHLERKTKISQMGVIARTPRSYGRATTWKSLTGCLSLSSGQQNDALSLADLLKAEKRAGASVVDASRQEKLDANAIYGRSDGVLPGGTNSLFLDGHMDQSSTANAKGLDALDLDMTEQTSPRLANANNLQDWDSSGILQASCAQNRAQSPSLCMPFVSGIFFKSNQSRGSPAGKTINHL